MPFKRASLAKQLMELLSGNRKVLMLKIIQVRIPKHSRKTIFHLLASLIKPLILENGKQREKQIRKEASVILMALVHYLKHFRENEMADFRKLLA